MAEDQIEVMRALGFERFHVMGHDRGARVAYRMALDHPEAVNKLVLLDIVSTYDMYSLSTREFAKALFQWYFFTQEAPLPEDMILSSRKQFSAIPCTLPGITRRTTPQPRHFPRTSTTSI